MNNINKIINCDCFDLFKNIEDQSIDLIIADPPYFQVCGDFDFSFKNREEYLLWCKNWLLESKRVLKNNGTLILWGGW